MYRDLSQGDASTTMLLAGAGRSGTTWLADLICSASPTRLMFEPFHSLQVDAFRKFAYFQYMSADEEDAGLKEFANTVMTGTIRHRWVDRNIEVLRPQQRLIKEIRANLFLKWLCDRFPDVPFVFLVRHPCAVVASRMHLDWWTDRDIEPMLNQENLVQDFLAPHLNLISNATTPEEKHAIVWCINNLVPIEQFGLAKLPMVFYEHLVARPEVEIPRALKLLKQSAPPPSPAVINRPSTTTAKTGAFARGQDPVASWKARLSQQQISRILRIVDAFDLGYLYDDATMPLIDPTEP